MIDTNKLSNILLSFDAKGDQNEFKDNIIKTIEKTIRTRQPLRLLSFTCSTIQSQYMFSDTPWLYVDTDVAGNNLINDLSLLTQILTKLRNVYPTELTILIGNTDPYYIYLQQFKTYNDKKNYGMNLPNDGISINKI